MNLNPAVFFALQGIEPHFGYFLLIHEPPIPHDTSQFYMDVSKNRGTPKWMVCNGKPYLLKWMIWGYPYFWKHPYIPFFKKYVFCFQDFRQSELEFALRWARPMAEDLTFLFFFGGGGWVVNSVPESCWKDASDVSKSGDLPKKSHGKSFLKLESRGSEGPWFWDGNHLSFKSPGEKILHSKLSKLSF